MNNVLSTNIDYYYGSYKWKKSLHEEKQTSGAALLVLFE